MISELDANKSDQESNHGSTLPLKERFNQLKNLVSLSPTLVDNKSINCELLFDVLNAVYYESQRLIVTSRNKQQQKFNDFIKPYFNKLQQLQLKASDFESLKIIGRGAFGKVELVKAKENGNIYAMKTLNKLEMLRRAETSFYREERDILLHGSKDWFTKLHFAFQDADALYLVMDYYIGGDLLTLISKYDDGLPEEMCRFYCAQIILALTHLHKMKYIHRDIKPDNILIDSRGHCRLADFGSCIKYDQLNRDGGQSCMVAVGTPDYLCYQLLNAMEGSKNLQKKSGSLTGQDGPAYGFEIDFWSLGVVLFECIYGETPFYAESLIETYAKILNYQHSFEFPENDQVSADAKDLILHLICPCDVRYKTLEQFQNHSFFREIDWENIRDQEPPYTPVCNGPDDTSNFDCDEIKEEMNANNNQKNLANAFSSSQKDSQLNLHLPFIGYTCTFTLDQVKEDSNIDNVTLNNLLNLEFSSHNDSQFNQPPPSYSEHGSDYQSSSSSQAKKIIMNLENELQLIRQERSELSAKLIEMRNEKSLIASKLRLKEEEIENQLDKTSEIRQQLRDAERLKRQHLEAIINLEGELDKEKQLRKENQYEIKELEEKMIVVEEQLINYQSINAMKEDDKFEQENNYVVQISDLKYQLNEKMHNVNEKQEIIKELQLKLMETDQRLIEQEKLINLNQQQENRIKDLENELEELRQLQPNWEKQISEIISWVGSEKEARSYLQEIAINMTKELENLKQQKQFNQYSNVSGTTSSSCSRYNGDKYSTLLNKSNLMNDSLNKSQQESNYSTITWQERRSARVDKSELLQLQLELKNEIEDKQRIQSELLRLQREMNSVMSELNESKSELHRLKQQKQKQDSQKSLNQFQLAGSTTNTLQSQVQLRNSNLISSGTNSQRQSLNLNNGSTILYQAQKDLQQKINAIQLSPLATADFSDMDLLSPSPTSDSYPNNQINKLSSFNSHMKNGNDNNHSFLIRTFVAPLKCFHCSSLMIGLVRQGLVCEICGFVSCVSCANPTSQLNSYLANSASQQAIMESSNINPIPSCPYDDSIRRPIGIDPIRGKGSAYEGYVKIPKAKGVKKGWTRMFVVVCDFKLFLYDLTATATDLGSNASSNHGNSNSMMSNKGFGTLNSNSNYSSNFSSAGDSVTYFNNPFVSVSVVVDMRDEQFSVSGVSESEVIHASKKDIPCIFKVCTSMLTEITETTNSTSQQSFGMDDQQQENHYKEQKFTQLMMVDRESEQKKWCEALHELHRIIRKNKLSYRNTLKSFKLLNSVQLPLLRNFTNVNCCCLIDETRILLGTEDGLLCVDLDIQVYRKIVKTNKVLLAEYSPADQLIVVLSGKRKIKLLPTKGLDHDNTEWVKLDETKGASLFKVCTQPQNNITLVCVATKKTLAIYEIVRKKSRYCLYREIQSALNITSLTAHQNGELIAIGSNSNFIVYHLTNREYPPLYLVNQECSQLNYLIQNSIEALCCFQVSEKEWLLLFAHYGVYVDYQGRRSRQVELQLATQPCYVATLQTQLANGSMSNLLLCFSATHIDVFDIVTANWIQTINLRLTKPLEAHCKKFMVCLSNAFDQPVLVQIVPSNCDKYLLKVIGSQNKPFIASGSNAGHRLISTGNSTDIPKKNIRLNISNPSNFSHISHLGPGSGPFGTSKIIDLNSVNTADLILDDNRRNSSSSDTAAGH